MLGVNNPALPASLRRTNQRTVISLLMRLGAASKADLAKAAGISQPTAGKITAELLRLGIIEQTEVVEAPDARKLGRPGQMLRLNAETARFIAIDLGVVQTRVAAVPIALGGGDEWTHSFATPNSPAAWARELRKAVARLKSPSVWGVLISVPGIVDEPAGKVLFSPNLHWLEKADLRALVGGVCGLPVELVQEIRALALGHLTAEASGEDFFLVDFGQGVGGAMVLDGQLFTPPMPLSGEFGHTPVPGTSRACGCGASACLETIISEPGLLQSFAEQTGRKASWKELSGHISRQGVPSWLGRTIQAAATVIAGALNILGVHRVVVTGKLGELPPVVFARLRDEISRGSMWARFGEVTTVMAPRRRAAGLVAVGVDRLVLPNAQTGRGAAARPQAALIHDTIDSTA
jgi:predicted NBD/HSP70 family sugar kinase